MTETAGRGHERTWRPPGYYRVVLILACGAGLAVPTAFGWFELRANGGPGPSGWPLLLVAVPLWGWFAFPGWTVTATLTAGTLVIRNVLSTERVAVDDITGAGFFSKRRVLRVTERRPLALSETRCALGHAGVRTSSACIKVQ